MNINNILSPTNARSEFYNVLKSVNENHKPIIISGSKSENSAVIIGKEDWDYIQEILNLEYSNTVNKSHKTKAESLYDTIGKQSLIASYGDSTSSIWGQRVAKDTVEQGHKVFHVVANNFEYHEDETKDDVIDISKVTINPLEVFGKVEFKKSEYHQLFSEHLEKSIKFLNLLSGRIMRGKQEEKLCESLVELYIQFALWSRNFDKDFETINILDADTDRYPTMKRFINFTFKHLEGKIRDDENRREDTRDFQEIEQALIQVYRDYINILEDYTEIVYPYMKDKEQHYFDLTEFADDSFTLEALLLNTLNYVLNIAESEDVIMIHGIDKMSVETLSVLKGSFNRAIENGVKIVYIFDTIGGNSSEEKEIEYANIFNTEGVLYQDINADFGFKNLGTMNLKDMELYREKIEKSLE